MALLRSPGALDGVIDLRVLVVADLAAGRVVQARVRALRAALVQQHPQGQPHLVGRFVMLTTRSRTSPHTLWLECLLQLLTATQLLSRSTASHQLCAVWSDQQSSCAAYQE